MMRERKNFFSDFFWRYLTNAWTVVFMCLIIADFLYQGKFFYLIAPFSVIYGTILGIFAGTKEFYRWQNAYKSRNHPGEIFVLLWSLLLLLIFLASLIFEVEYQISSEIISVYIMVLTIFALTQSSKRIYSRKKIIFKD